MTSPQTDFSHLLPEIQDLGKESLYGLERECLRVDADGVLSQSPHPKALGASLTHPSITTDFSESQIEFTTQAHASIDAALGELEDLQNFVCTNLDGEFLWPMSMPALLPDKDEDIPLAYYGESQEGQKKTIYRRGLGHRYGRRMQTISGIHFNFSFGRPLIEQLWEGLSQKQKNHYWNENSSKSNGRFRNTAFQNFTNDMYFHVIRNFFRRAAAVPYLFGASPALDKSFFGAQANRIPGRLQRLGKRTLYHPTATSLRLSGIGYTNPKQRLLHISYNNLKDYLKGLNEALRTPCPDYAVYKVEAQEQLNSNLLQIENEHYAPIRPKPKLEGYERPMDALKHSGVEYLEIRSLDLNPFVPVAVDKERLAFMEMLLYDCLFSPSQTLSEEEKNLLEQDFQLSVWHGRKSKLRLSTGQSVSEAGNGLCDRLEIYAELLGSSKKDSVYSLALKTARERFSKPALTPSARLLSEIRDMGDMLTLGRYLSQEYCRYFGTHRLSIERLQELRELAEASHRKQEKLDGARLCSPST